MDIRLLMAFSSLLRPEHTYLVCRLCLTYTVMYKNVITELTKYATVIGNRFADSLNSAVYDFSTGTVVVDILQGDHVYVRMGGSTGQIKSISYSRTTFSSWLLH